MATTIHPLITLEEFLKLPETKPASELINGRIYQKPMPQGKHSRLQLKLCNAVNQVAEEQQIALAFPELRCTFGGRSIVPDVTVFSWERIPFDADEEIENVFEIHPDWTIEILSPTQKATKVISNILHCLEYGTQLGWFIDPDERLVLAFFPGQQPVELTGDNRLPIPEFLELRDWRENRIPVKKAVSTILRNLVGTLLTCKSLNLTVTQLFGWLKAGR